MQFFIWWEYLLSVFCFFYKTTFPMWNCWCHTIYFLYSKRSLNVQLLIFCELLFQRNFVWLIQKMSLGCLSLDQEIGASDAVLLDPLTEDTFIANLHQRFKRDQIYVSYFIYFIYISIKSPCYNHKNSIQRMFE